MRGVEKYPFRRAGRAPVLAGLLVAAGVTAIGLATTLTAVSEASATPGMPLVAEGAATAESLAAPRASGIRASLPQQREICAGAQLPPGWIVVDARWSATRCGPTEGIEHNVWTIQRYDNAPADATMTVCAFAPTPSGWVVESTRWNATRCGEGSPSAPNVKVIRRLGRGETGIHVQEEGFSFSWGDSDAGLDRSFTGIYSDLRVIEETGDVLGAEIQLIASHDAAGRLRYHALVQFAEGVLEPPQLVSVDVRGSELEFVATYAGMRMPFRGRVERGVLEGRFDGPMGRVRLPRGHGFWE